MVSPKIVEPQSTLQLVAELCRELTAGNVSYCHWKSNAKLDRSASGENDLDLLVGRSSVQQFTEILFRVGFKQAFDLPGKQMPGVLDFYGYDQVAQRIVHVHAHYQLVMGHDATKNYHLPIEKNYIDSTVQDRLFKIPSPEFELIVLIIRLMVKHFTWDVVLLGNGRLKEAERQELAFLQEKISQQRLNELLQNNLPCIEVSLFSRCLQSLTEKRSLFFRIKAGQELRRQLGASTRRSQASDILAKVWHRFDGLLQRRLFHSLTKKRLASGGLMIAIVGGDGSGKTTALEGLHKWLSEVFDVKMVHLGKPRWSFLTKLIRGIIKIGTALRLYPFLNEGSKYTIASDSPSFPGYPWLIREVCTARDRYLVYRMARRYASNGGLVLCDRFPLQAVKFMDGPQVERVTRGIKSNRFIRFLAGLEEKYYRRILLPDLLLTLRVDPEISVQRKTSEAPETVRPRASEIWSVDWSTTPAHVVDASKSKTQVLADLKTLIWSNL
jgi:thymidylate kinase